MALDPEVKMMAKAKTKASTEWSKYKETGSKRSYRKAKYNYGIVEGYTKKFENPATVHTTNSVRINDSFKKTTTKQIASNNSVRVRKQVSQKSRPTNKPKK